MTTATSSPPGSPRSIWPVLIAAWAGMAVLVGLGIWQVERLHWKEDILARLESRRNAPPVAIPPEAQWPALRPDDYDYRRVTVTGVFVPGATAMVYRGAAPSGVPGEGPGYLALTPLRLPDGAIVIVNRGFVPQERAGAVAVPDGDVTITGLMRPPEPRNAFTPADNPAKDQWFTRDPGAIAAALGLARAAPFTIDAEATPGATGYPRGGQTVFDIPNNHLSYAVTWFGLAATLAGVTLAYLWRTLR